MKLGHTVTASAKQIRESSPSERQLRAHILYEISNQ